MGVWGLCPQAGVEPLHPLQNFYFAGLVIPELVIPELVIPV
jgi:hypothetical protein